MKKYYSGEPGNIHIQQLIHNILENIGVIITKKDKGKLPLFCGNQKRVIPIYDIDHFPQILLYHFTHLF